MIAFEKITETYYEWSCRGHTGHVIRMSNGDWEAYDRKTFFTDRGASKHVAVTRCIYGR